MTTSKIATSGAAVVLALTLSTAGYEVIAGREAEAARRALQQETATLAAMLREDQRRAAESGQAAAAAQRALEVARAAQVSRQSRPAPTPLSSKRIQSLAEAEAATVPHPEVRRAEIHQWRASAAGHYAPLFKALHLSPAQIEQFKDLSALGALGDRKAAETQLRTLLGEEGFRQYRAFPDDAAPAWQMTTQVTGALFDTATPLTQQQGERLTAILTENRGPTDWSKRFQYDWSAIIPKAAAVLSEAQLATLERYRAEDELGQAMTQARMQYASNPSPAPVSAPARK